MYIQVRLLRGFTRPLTYKIPPTWHTTDLLGTFIRVPLRNKPHIAFIEQIIPALDATKYEIKQALALEATPHDSRFIPFIKKLAYYHQIDYINLIKRIRDFIHQNQMPEDFLATETPPRQQSILTAAQQAIVDTIKKQIKIPNYQATLLHGVTCSGKT